MYYDSELVYLKPIPDFKPRNSATSYIGKKHQLIGTQYTYVILYIAFIVRAMYNMYMYTYDCDYPTRIHKG